MVTFPHLFIVTAAVLLCGALTDAQEIIRNFQANKNSTHITFSWDIVDGYNSYRYINNVYIYYVQRPHTGYYSYIGPISYSDSNLIKIGTSFQYTTTVTYFGILGQYVMWVRVYGSRLTPNYAYSDQIYIEVGREITIEVNIQLWPSQTCLEFTAQSTSTYSAVQNEVYWGIRKYCQCNYDYFQYIRLNNGYFTCAAGGYVTFRANLVSTDVTADPADLKSILTAWLHGQDTDKTITIYGRQYSVEPGPCGVTVPHLYAPKCSTPNTTGATPTDAAISSTVTAPTQDNIAVIVASVFATMFFILSLGLIGYILAARRHQTTRSTGGRVARTTKPSDALAQAATRRQQPGAINMCAKQECDLESRCHIEDPDQIYTEMDDF